MRKLCIFAAFLFFTGISLSSSAQTVDEVIDKYIKAVGGIENISAVKSMIAKGNVRVMGIDLPVTLMFKRDNKFRAEISVQGNLQIQAFDGTTAWQTNPHSGNSNAEKMPVEGVKDMKEKSDFEGLLVNYSQKGYSAELMGKEDMEGSEVYKIKLTNKDNDVTFYYLDAASYFVLKKSGKKIVMEKEIEYEAAFSNYKSYGGVMIALTREFKGKNGGQEQTVTIETVDINPVIDDNIFVIPSNK